jgi:hypothetical protein
MARACWIGAHQLQRAIITTPAFVANASAWIVTGAMSTAAPGYRAIYSKKSSEAQARAFNAITIVRALVRTEHLASLSTVANFALALTIAITNSLAVAVVWTHLRGYRPKSQTFVVWMNRRWCFNHS